MELVSERVWSVCVVALFDKERRLIRALSGLSPKYTNGISEHVAATVVVLKLGCAFHFAVAFQYNALVPFDKLTEMVDGSVKHIKTFWRK